MFWDECTDPDSIMDCLDSQYPRQRRQILRALEDSRTFGEWVDPNHKALLYGDEQGVVVLVRDKTLAFILREFFQAEQNKQHWHRLEHPEQVRKKTLSRMAEQLCKKLEASR